LDSKVQYNQRADYTEPDDHMTEFPFQLFVKRTSLNNQAELSTFREFKQYLQKSKRHMRIKAGEYIAELDRRA